MSEKLFPTFEEFIKEDFLNVGHSLNENISFKTAIN